MLFGPVNAAARLQAEAKRSGFLAPAASPQTPAPMVPSTAPPPAKALPAKAPAPAPSDAGVALPKPTPTKPAPVVAAVPRRARVGGLRASPTPPAPPADSFAPVELAASAAFVAPRMAVVFPGRAEAHGRPASAAAAQSVVNGVAAVAATHPPAVASDAEAVVAGRNRRNYKSPSRFAAMFPI
jgi:hypothetical protein